jgi:hypothetical protein
METIYQPRRLDLVSFSKEEKMRIDFNFYRLLLGISFASKKRGDYTYTNFGDMRNPLNFEYFTSNPSTGITSIRIEKTAGFERLDEYQQFNAKLSAMSILMSVQAGYLDFNRIRRITDFGSGSGGPTFTLVEIGKRVKAHIDAIEEDPKFAQQIIKSGILPEENVNITDGIAYFMSMGEKGIEKYDLITAFMLGPDPDMSLFRRLVKACTTALNEGGNLLITSDTCTFSAIKKILESLQIPFHFIAGVMDEKEITVQNTLIISKESLRRIALKS